MHLFKYILFYGILFALNHTTTTFSSAPPAFQKVKYYNLPDNQLSKCGRPFVGAATNAVPCCEHPCQLRHKKKWVRPSTDRQRALIAHWKSLKATYNSLRSTSESHLLKNKMYEYKK